MGLFKIFKNKRHGHPCLEVDHDKNSWRYMTITHEPFVYELKVNPNKNDTKQAYLSKYIQQEKIATKGNEMKNYSISLVDQIEILKILNKNKKSSDLGNKSSTMSKHAGLNGSNTNQTINQSNNIKSQINNNCNKNFNNGGKKQ